MPGTELTPSRGPVSAPTQEQTPMYLDAQAVLYDCARSVRHLARQAWQALKHDSNEEIRTKVDERLTLRDVTIATRS
ncbi:hypothetical protein DOTSEDRAFT_75305 [Dothistroma septosporum NZE10]|uniref:Uncharacterized protein n=1 Tax=Dothistroma septosporum (strain NZE10 / CBS 128990) TaxID=675120 RepID=M2YKW8_DOTSN|nr:hypothetical protein DOTSEDRAFT_75305 [Dothistroma septosporum NZE10]